MRPTILALLLTFAMPLHSIAADDPYAAQRAIFVKLLPKAEAGDWRSVEPQLDALQGYPLAPDLRAAWLRRKVGAGTDSEIDEYLRKYPDLAFSYGLRLRWAKSLASRRAWPQYLAVYNEHYADSEDTVLHCWALRARIATGANEGLEESAMAVWLSAFSQPKECDPVFAYLEDNGAITDDRRRQRIALALDAGQVQLARYLARPLSDADRDTIDQWDRMRADPARELRRPDKFEPSSDANRRLVRYGFRRLARRDSLRANELWALYGDFPFEDSTRTEIGRSIALSAATSFKPQARELLEAQSRIDDDLVIAQWRARLAVRDLDWKGTLQAIADMPVSEAQRINWRFWQARALEGSGKEEKATEIFIEISGQRDYYGFLAADRLGREYHMNHAAAEADEAVISELEERNDFQRAHELFRTGLFSRGRVEWQRALNRLTASQQSQASIVAARWGWHSRAISTASNSGLDNDLDLRFPTPWEKTFARLSRNASLNTTWVYGIARSESLFMPDVASGAGAVGLMQLMPATGAETARKANIRYKGRHSLVQPETNITLGTRYLAEMMERFNNNQVMATAAYNAGPHRVQSWLPKGKALPADAWVDSVPYRETRRYVRRVLAAQTVFDWRMGGSDVRLSDRMAPVPDKIAGSVPGLTSSHLVADL
jgi:soluble lytic murein transglycosylase